jgi:hypothetical protein
MACPYTASIATLPRCLPAPSARAGAGLRAFLKSIHAHADPNGPFPLLSGALFTMHVCVELKQQLVAQDPNALVEAGPLAYRESRVMSEYLVPDCGSAPGLDVVLKRPQHSKKAPKVMEVLRAAGGSERQHPIPRYIPGSDPAQRLAAKEISKDLTEVECWIDS